MEETVQEVASNSPWFAGAIMALIPMVGTIIVTILGKKELEREVARLEKITVEQKELIKSEVKLFENNIGQLNLAIESQLKGLKKYKEEQNFRKVLKPTDTVILLDNHGKQFHSIGFAKYLEKKMAHSRGRICFLIGGAHGFSEAMHNEFKDKVSLSEMTFSHQLIRLIFWEQLYRAIAIIKGLPYHND